MSNRKSRSEPPDADHLADVADGSGCFEIWAHLSDVRDHQPSD